MLWKTKKPLLQCDILHDLPGRMRVGCKALHYLGDHKSEIRERLEDTAHIQTVSVSIVTANVLVYYDPDKATPHDIFDLTESVIGIYSLIAYKAEREALNKPTVQERRLQEETIQELLGRVIVTSVTLLFSWYGRADGRGHVSLLRRFISIPAITSISLALPILRSGWESLKTRYRPNADTLSATAILASLAAGQDVSALTIIWLADIAELLTAYTMERTRRAIREMLSIGEEFVWRLREDDTEEKVAIDDLAAGDRIMVHTGEKVSVDGTVIDGEAAVDQASITGEFMPVKKEKGDEVFAGTVVKSGRIIIRAEKVGDETAVARVVHMVEEATHRKATVQTLADRFSTQFIPVNFALALIVYAITRKATRALNMLIIDYSCGVRLSTATALSASICSSARNGILIKGGNYLEMLSEADTLILDKTGTITEGRPQVTRVKPATESLTERDVLQYAAAAEETSTHPMAVAIIDKVRKSGWAIPKHMKTEVHTARGVSTKVGRSIVRVGSRRFMQDHDIDLKPVEEAVHRLARKGENIIYVSKGKSIQGVLGVQDALRENMKKALNRLRQSGMDDIILLTGDVEQHAEIVASRMMMDSYKAEVLPDDKAEVVLRLQSKGTHVVMVGDGINDAPALAYADVGIAMGGTRTDIAIEAADITITRDDPLMIPAVIRLANKTMNIVRQNFMTAVGVNSLGIVLAAIGVLPVFWGAVLHNSSTVAVVLNSSRLLFHDVESK